MGTVTQELILLVEDDPVVTRMASDLLEDVGRRIVTVSSVREAVDFVHRTQPTLLLTDYSLPDGTGEDLLETLSDLPLGLPPFIVMTGAGDERIAVEMLKRGARDYLVKTPDFLQELPLAVNRVLRELLTEEQLKRAQQVIFSREEQLRCAFEQAAVGMAFSDLNGRLRGFNRKYQEMTGYSATELNVATYQQLTHPDDLAKQLDLTARLLTGEFPSFELEKRYIRKSGESVLANTTVTLIRNQDGMPLQLFAVVEDLSEIHQKNQRLEQLQSQLLKAQEIGKIFNYEWDLASGHIDWTLQGYALLERPAGSFEQTIAQWFEFVHPDDRATLQQAIEGALAGLQSHAEYRLIMPDGRNKPVITFGELKRSPEGMPVSIYGITQDLSERKQYENRLREALARAETSNVAKSTFLANMSHELRTPLNGILGMLQLIESGQLDDEQSDYVRIASSSGWSLLRLLDDLLDLSRIEAGRMVVRNEPVDLHECLGAVLDLFRQSTHDKGLALTEQVAPEVPAKFVSDGTRLRQILFNLVGNAVKFTSKGEISIRIDVAGPPDGGWQRLLLQVNDTGIGMSAEMLARVGEPFSQEAETGYRRNFQGAGLGLSIVKRLAALMGGALTIASEPGSGTRVTVDLQVGVVK